VKVERVERLSDRMRVVHVSTPEESAAACPSCGVWLSPLCPRAAVLDHPSARDAARAAKSSGVLAGLSAAHTNAPTPVMSRPTTMGSMRQ